MNIQDGYNFNYLTEDASYEDQFEDRTHEHVAISLERLIESTSPGITIGIEGAWGSGKSTVIQLLKQKLLTNSSTNTLLFPFDAWAHEGDPLRRVFLESLITCIDPKNNDSYLADLKNNISGRTKTVQIRTGRKASKLTSLLSISALFVPPGAAILSAVDYSALLTPWSTNAGPTNWPFLVGSVLCFLPLILILYWRFFGPRDSKGKTKWDFLEETSTENVTQDITEDGERTSVEFEHYFEAILSHVLSRTNHSQPQFDRAVIVIDNLDRVDANLALTLWSTLQTFFKYKSNLQDEILLWRKKVWFIVPHDRSGLSRLWDSRSSDSEITKGLENYQDSLARSFVEKCFQVRLEVPEPVITGWHSYLTRSVNEGLTEWPESERTIVVEVFSQYFSTLHVSPTPRKIRNFVNQVGVLGLRWGGVNLPNSIAAYALLRADFVERDVRKQLISGGLPTQFSEHQESERISQELAGMLFGVDRTKGMQLLLSPSITEALRNSDASTLREFAKQHGQGFWTTWNNIHREHYSTEVIEIGFLTSSTIAVAEGLQDHRLRIEATTNKLLEYWEIAAPKFDLSTHTPSRALTALGEIVNGEQEGKFKELTTKLYEEQLRRAVNDPASEDITPGFLTELNSILEILKSQECQPKLKKYASLDSSKWPIWSSKINSARIATLTACPADNAIAEISKATFTAESNKVDQTRIESLISAIRAFPSSPDWKAAATHLTSWANKASRESSELVYELIFLIQTKCKGAPTSIVNTCTKESAFWSKSEQIADNSYLPLIALISLSDNTTLETTNDELRSYFCSEYSAAKSEWLVGKLRNSNLIELLWKFSLNKSLTLPRSIITNDFDQVATFTPSLAALRFSQFEWSQDFQLTLARYIATNLLATCRSEFQKSLFDSDQSLYEIYALTKESTSPIVQEVLDSITEEDWLIHLQSNTYILNFALHREFRFDHRYTDALRKHVFSIIEGSEFDDWVLENFSSLLAKALDKEHLIQDIAEHYFRRDHDDISDKKFLTFANALLNDLRKVPESQIMRRLDMWLNDESMTKVGWLVSSGYAFSEPPLQTISSRLTGLLKSAAPEELEVLMQLCQMLSIVPQVEATEESKPIDAETQPES